MYIYTYIYTHIHIYYEGNAVLYQLFCAFFQLPRKPEQSINNSIYTYIHIHIHIYMITEMRSFTSCSARPFSCRGNQSNRNHHKIFLYVYTFIEINV